MTNETQIIDDLQPFINLITSAPLPSIPGMDGRFYLEIEAIRCSAVNKICCALLVRTKQKHGNDAAESLRECLEPIRESLLAVYPDCAALLDAETWPNQARRH